MRSSCQERADRVVMALGGQGARLAPGMPGAPGRPPGWRRRGCRRPPRTGRTARSRRSATRRPHQAGPVRSRRGAAAAAKHCVLELGVPPAAEGGLGQEPLAQSLQGQRIGPAGPAPVQRVRGEAEEHLAREGVVARVQGRKLAHQTRRRQRRGRARRAGPGGQSRRPRAVGPLPGGHVTTVRRQLIARRPYRRMPAGPGGCLMSCMTHLNRRFGRPCGRVAT